MTPGRITRVGALLGTLAVVLGTGGMAGAHGGVLLIASEVTGPYALTIERAPGASRPGPLDLTILVEHARTGGAVADAQVTVEAARVGDPAPLAPRAAIHDAVRPAVYAVVVPLPTTGVWRLTVRVTGSMGSGLVVATVAVTAAAGGGWSWRELVTGAASGGVLVWAGSLVWRLVRSAESGGAAASADRRSSGAPRRAGAAARCR